MELWQAIAAAITAAVGQTFVTSSHRAIGGGCISAAYLVEGLDGGRYFVKTHDRKHAGMFAAEAEALQALAATASLRVPRVIAWGAEGGQAYLVLEYLDLGGAGGAARLGECLAALHGHTAARYGWHRDNTLGATPQPNPWTDTWLDFWREQRLGQQLRLAAARGHGGRLQQRGGQLLDALPSLLAGHTPVASLLHGDLWSGNYAYTRGGEPVVYDPATYYGDRETDLAMTELFGGFSREFYAAYNAHSPLDSGYPVRKTLYNLYHVLNHLNLFGGGYAARAERMMDQLLAEAR